MLASVFVTGGIDTLKNPGPRAELAEPVVDKIVEAAQPVAESLVDTKTPLPFETETYVKINAAVQVGAGILLAAGKVPRLASAALAATIVPTTVAGHRFWEAEGAERQAQQVHFMKNVSVLGGLILAAVDTEGRPGLGYRAKHGRDEAKIVSRAAQANATLGSRALKANARAAGRLAAANATDAGAVTRRKAKAAGKVARKEALGYGKVARKQAQVIGKQASKHADAYAKLASARASELADVASERAADLSKVAQAKGHDLAARAQDLVGV